jgi:hypothetical protein
MLRRYVYLLLPTLLWLGATASPSATPQGAAVKQAKPLRPPTPKPVASETLEAAIARGVEYLCKSQNADGSWGSPRWTGGVDVDPVPGAFHSFGVACTALCLEALLNATDSPKVRAAAGRAEAYLLANLPKLRRGDPGNLPNVWGYCYGIQVLAELHRRAPPDSDRRRMLEKLIGEQREGLKRCETVHGGWFYYASGFQRPLAPSCSFVNASVLVAFHRAKGLGVGPDERMLKRAVKSTAEQRNPDSSFLYSMMSPLTKGGAARPINRPAGSLGRSQACNLALRLWGDERITDDVLRDWLDRLVTRNGWLDMGRKRPIPHESFAQVAGYFFYFGHYYAALCISELPEADRPFYQDHLARLLMRLQEPDGSWWDYPMYSYHKAYGTAFALLSLECCRKAAAGR